jgi:uncharacterized protein with FMN-binding domain
VRISTKTAVSAISLGLLGLSYQLGTTATAATNTFASPTENASPEATASATSSPSPTASAEVATGSSATSESTKTAPQPAVSASASPSASASKPATTTTSGVSKTGDSVESGFGPVQVKVTKVGNKITEITYLQAVATKGRAAAFPYLVQYAIDANGSGFANLSGATYTTDAFKQSLESALAKF